MCLQPNPGDYFMKLTKDKIEGVLLPKKGQKFVWDSETRGFGLRLTPTTRTYVVQARINGITRRVSLGKHGILTVQEARKKAIRELSKMLDGKDPVIEKKRAVAQSVTLGEVVEAYLSDRRSLKESSKADILKHLNNAFSDWADKPISSITRDMALTRFRELSDKGPAQANQAYRNLRAWFNYAIGAYRADGKPTIAENPVKAISDLKMWNHVKPRSGRIPLDKVGIAWNELQRLRAEPFQTDIGRTLADAVTFLMLTGARFSEMSSLTWEQVNIEEKSWTLPDPKNRTEITFPLSGVTIDILKNRPQDSKFIFPSRTKTGHVGEVRNTMKKISKAVGVHITAHDLRRTFRAIAGECGVDFWKTKLLMGHKISGDVTIMHYTETDDLRYLSDEINIIGDWITQQGAIAKSDNVVPFPTKNKEAVK
jgi:integrase